MALWNDKRTPPGIVTDTTTGQLGRMGAGATRGGFQPVAPYSGFRSEAGRPPDSKTVARIKAEAATKRGDRTGAFAVHPKTEQSPTLPTGVAPDRRATPRPTGRIARAASDFTAGLKHGLAGGGPRPRGVSNRMGPKKLL